MARKKKKPAETTATADVAVADTVETTAKMDAAIGDEVKTVKPTEVEARIMGTLQATGCGMTMVSGKSINIFGPDRKTVKNGSANVWRVLGRLRREEKIDEYPTVTTEVVKK